MKSSSYRYHCGAVLSLFLVIPWTVNSQVPAGGSSAGGNSTSGGTAKSGSPSSGAKGSSSTRGSANKTSQNQNNRQQQSTTQNPNSPQQQSTTQNPNSPQQQSNAQNPNSPQQQSNAQNPNSPQRQSTIQNPASPQQQGSAQNPTSPQQEGNAQYHTSPLQSGNTRNPNASQQQGNLQNPNMTNGQVQFAGTSSAGTIRVFGTNGFSMLANEGGATQNYQLSEGTVFIDSMGRSIPRERFSSETPAMVYYVKSGNDLIATQVIATEAIVTEEVATEAPAVFASGTITEVSPGILVIEMPGASLTQVRYVDNKTTNYVDQHGTPVPIAMIKSGSPAKVFYTKVGDTLVASKVEVMRRDENPGLPKPPVIIEETVITPLPDSRP